MTTTGREMVAGTGAAGVFVGLFLAGSMPWWLALVLAGAVYTGLRFLLPVVPPPEEVGLEGGGTQAELQALVQGGRQHLITLRTLADRLRLQQPACSADVMTLRQAAERILGRIERQPQSMYLASLFPMYLETIVGNLQRYTTLMAEEHGQTARRKSLMATEEMVRTAIAAFEQLWERLAREDWLALEAEADTLKALFEIDLG
jgi:5-bromo-4-chloroindolyl phosphate hydrolysis protein